MATRQYIGARYVPLYDGTWSATKNYEALTIVEFNNGSYISKKASVAGIAPTNTEYWANIGVHTQQIEDLIENISSIGEDVSALQTSVAEINDDIYNIVNKKVLFVGDSYGARTDNWCDKVANKLGLSSSQYTNLSVSGTGFCRDDNVNGFLQQITNYTENRDEITDIIVCGGLNDSVTDGYNTNLENGIKAFIDYAKANYTKAPPI